MPMLLMGCDGGTNATSGVVPEVTRRMYELVRGGAIGEAVELQLKLLPLFDLMVTPDFPDGFRAGAALRGFEFERSPRARLSGTSPDCAAAHRGDAPFWVEPERP